MRKIKPEPLEVDLLTKKSAKANSAPAQLSEMMSVSTVSVKLEPGDDGDILLLSKRSANSNFAQLEKIKIKSEQPVKFSTKETTKITFSRERTPTVTIKVEPKSIDDDDYGDAMTKKSSGAAANVAMMSKVKPEPIDVRILKKTEKVSCVAMPASPQNIKLPSEPLDIVFPVMTKKSKRILAKRPSLTVDEKVVIKPEILDADPVTAKKKGQRGKCASNLQSESNGPINVKVEQFTDQVQRKKGRAALSRKGNSSTPAESTLVKLKSEPNGDTNFVGEDNKPMLVNTLNSFIATGNPELEALTKKREKVKKDLAALEQEIFDYETKMFQESSPYGNIFNLSIISDCSSGRRRSMRNTEIDPNLRLASLSSTTAISNVPEFAAQLLRAPKVEKENEQSSSGVNGQQGRKRK